MDATLFKKRALFGSELQDWRCPKVARTEKTPMPTTSSPSSSSSCSPSSSFPVFNDGQNMLSFSSPKMESLGFSYHYPSSKTTSCTSAAHRKDAGMMGSFTPTQWMELEHQALIYRYMHANVPIPSGLLFAIMGSISPSGHNAAYPARSLEPCSYGCGPIQPGVSGGGSMDLEPGRCRRTDGKKWRCSRDAMVDQKYCERHMNRGRHRSRKPVEATAELVMPLISQRQTPRKARSGSPSASSFAASRCPPPKDSNRTKTSHNYFHTESNSTVPNQHISFGWLHPSTDSGFAPAKSHSNVSSTYQDPYHPTLRSFLDSWPHNKTCTEPPPWLTSNLDEHAQVKPTIPQLKLLCQEPDNAADDARKEFWEGGPLGEVLNNTNNKPRGSTEDLSDLNLMLEGWRSCPTAVLQKGDMGSVSSSTRSSPRAENWGNHDSNGSLCEGLFGSRIVNSSSIQSF